jgi:hypothetical protein
VEPLTLGRRETNGTNSRRVEKIYCLAELNPLMNMEILIKWEDIVYELNNI